MYDGRSTPNRSNPPEGGQHESESAEVSLGTGGRSRSLSLSFPLSRASAGVYSVFRSRPKCWRGKSGGLQGWPSSVRFVETERDAVDRSGCRQPRTQRCELQKRLRFL